MFSGHKGIKCLHGRKLSDGQLHRSISYLNKIKKVDKTVLSLPGHAYDKFLDTVHKICTMKGKSQKDIMKLRDFRTDLADTVCWYHSRSEN